jgi:hypothetical protein
MAVLFGLRVGLIRTIAFAIVLDFRLRMAEQAAGRSKIMAILFGLIGLMK